MFDNISFGTPNEVTARYVTGNIPVVSCIYHIDIAKVCTPGGKGTKLKGAKDNTGDLVLFHITQNSTTGDGNARTVVADPKGGWPKGGIGLTTENGVQNLVEGFTRYLMRKHAHLIQEWIDEQGYEIKFKETSDPLLDEKIDFIQHAKQRWKMPYMELDEAEDIRTELERFKCGPALIEEATHHVNRVRLKNGMGKETIYKMPEKYSEEE